MLDVTLLSAIACKLAIMILRLVKLVWSTARLYEGGSYGFVINSNRILQLLNRMFLRRIYIVVGFDFITLSLVSPERCRCLTIF